MTRFNAFLLFAAAVFMHVPAQAEFYLHDFRRPLDDALLVRATLLAGEKMTEEAKNLNLVAALELVATPQVAMLLEAGLDPNECLQGYTPLMLAENGDIVEVYLAAGAEVKPQRVPYGARYERTALHYAADAKAVRLLIAAGEEVDACPEEMFRPMTPLCYAQNAEVTRALLEAGANPRFRARDSMSPLCFAPDAESARLLLAAGANVRARNDDGRMSIHYARNADVAKVLLAAGASANVKDKRGQSPLHMARNTGVARVLLEAGADVHAKAKSPVSSYAANDKAWITPLAALFVILGGQEDREAIARLLLEAGADANVADPDGETLLVQARTPEMTRLLLEAGADVHAKDKYGKTALFYARDAETVRLLMAAGADPLKEWENPLFFVRDAETAELYLSLLCDAGRDVKALLAAREERGFTPLLLALWHNRPGAARVLLDAGAEKNVANAKGETPLHFGPDAGLVRLLIDAGADVNARTNKPKKHKGYDGGFNDGFVDDSDDEPQDIDQEGVVHWGARSNWFAPLHVVEDVDAAKLLLAAGADVNAVTGDGQTPLHLHASSPAVVRELLAAGADVNARDERGRTPLHYSHHPQAARQMIEAGAKLEARDADGETPLSLSFAVAYHFSHWELMANAGADFHVRNHRGQTLLHCGGGEVEYEGRGMCVTCCERDWMSTRGTTTATRPCTMRRESR